MGGEGKDGRREPRLTPTPALPHRGRGGLAHTGSAMADLTDVLRTLCIAYALTAQEHGAKHYTPR